MALIQGTLVGIAFAIVGLPSAVVFGALAALASLLPFGGTALVWLPGRNRTGWTRRWWQAIFIFVWGALLVSLVDNVVRPLFVSGAPMSALLPYSSVSSAGSRHSVLSDCFSVPSFSRCAYR